MIIEMRRISAILLMALFSFPLIGPMVFTQDADSKLPACCRRNGKHHCAQMAAQAESSSGPALQTARCGFFPNGQGVPINPGVSPTPTSQAVFAGLLSHPASRPQTDALCRISYSRAGQKRGPPISHS